MEPLTATQAQLGIWLGHQAAADSAIYNAAQLILLEQGTRVDALEQAILGTLQEASALHVSWKEVHGMPVALPFEQRRHEADLRERLRTYVVRRELTAADLDRHVQSAVSVPFELTLGDTFRHFILELSDGRIAWLHLAHHIALDGYGFHLLARRVAERYSAILSEKEPSPNPFHDLRAAHQEDLNYQGGPAREQDARYLKELLRDQDEGLSFPLPAPAFPRRDRHILSEELDSALSGATAQRRLSHGDVFLAASARIWGRWTDRRRVTLGVPVMLRLGTCAQRVPCMAMNIVPLPVEVAQNEALLDLAARIQGQQRAHKTHQRFRYEHLPAILGHAKIFSPTVNVMPFDVPLSFGGSNADIIDVAAGPVQDLSLSWTRKNGRSIIGVDTHPRLFSPRSSSVLLGELEQELQRAATELRPAAHRAREQKKSGALVRSPVDPLLQLGEHIRETPSRPALGLSDGTILTYEHLGRVVVRGAQLVAQHARPGDVVALDLPRGALSVVMLLATLEAGCTYLVLDPLHPPARRAAILSCAKARLLVHGVDGLADATFAGVGMPIDWAALLAESLDTSNRPDALGTTAWPEALAYLVFTSGSTGVPKGVAISRRALSHFVAAAKSRYGFTPSDRVLQFAALSFDASVEEVFVTLCSGATLVLRDDQMVDSVQHFLAEAARQRLTVLDLPTAYFHEVARALAHLPMRPWPELRVVIVGGEALRPDAVRFFFAWAPEGRLVNSYGPSEATVVALTAEVDVAALYEDAVPIGRPLDGIDAVILDDVGVPIETAWLEGQLYLRGPTLADGYLDAPQETARRFASLPGLGRAYQTGDRVCRDFAGELVFRGRVDREVKIAGQRIDPEEVERVLGGAPYVRQAAVWGAPRQDGGVLLCAAVEPGHSAFSVAQLREHARLHLPPVMVPTRISLVERLPRNSAGKVDRLRIIRETMRGAPEVHRTLRDDSASPLEAQICALWSQVLGVDHVSPHDDFFGLGGSSLQVIQLVNRLSEHGLSLTVKQVFQAATPARQAELAAGGEGRSNGDAAFVPSVVPLMQVPPDPDWIGIPDTNEVDSFPLLLTGATGFLGLLLLHKVLEHTSHSVVCLVRAQDNQHAELRLFSAADARGIDIGRFRQRLLVRAVARNEPIVHALEDLPRCSRVIHAAAAVSLNRDYESLLADNVLLTRDLLQYTQKSGAEFHLISSLATVPPETLGTAHSERLFEFHEHLRDGYQRSKAHAERLSAEAQQLGIPVAVYRLGRIVGSRSKPSVNPSDIVWRIAASATRLEMFPRLQLREPWTPVDEVAARVVALVIAGSARAPRDVYHLGSPLMSVGRLGAALARSGYPLITVPLSVWLEELRKSPDPEDRATAAFFDLRQDLEGPKWSAAPCSAADEYSGEREIIGAQPDVRPIDDALLDDYVRAAARAGLLTLAKDRGSALSKALSAGHEETES